ncbi:UNVERIFIED_CONTAM: hypothetical protein NY100_34085, partial [Prevotella sp. 15_C9]
IDKSKWKWGFCGGVLITVVAMPDLHFRFLPIFLYVSHMYKKAFFLTKIFLFYLTNGYSGPSSDVTGTVTADGRPQL